MDYIGTYPPKSQHLWKGKPHMVFTLWILCVIGFAQADMDRPFADFQLTGGKTLNEGRLEVRLPNTTEWHGICKDSFYPLYASIICRDLGWWSACQTLASNNRVSPTPTQGGDNVSSIVTLQASCFGSESSLRQCNDVNFPDASDSCKAGEDVWLVCLADSIDLEIRLSGGDLEGEGYVEMRCPGQKWSTVCAQDWDIRDADTVCRQLGFSWSYSTTPQAVPGVNLGEIGYGRVLCTGKEDLVGECAFTVQQECHSFNSAVAGVKCGVDFSQQSADVSVTLCGGHHCKHAQSMALISDPRQHCRCDCQCAKFNDCCYDISNQDTSCNDSSTIWGGLDSSFFDCIPVPGSAIYHTAYVLISKCPDAVTNAADRTMCEMERDFNDVIGLLPVFDSAGVVYKNIFCAICHGLTVRDITQWGIRLNYDPSKDEGGYVNPSLIISVAGEIVGFEVLPSGRAAEVRRCPFNVIDTCSINTTSIIEIACSFYFAPVTFNNTLYRNPHCAVCNGVDLPQTQYCTECGKECPIDPFLPCFNSSCPRLDNFEKIDVQFSLDAFFEGVYGQAETVSCSRGNIYDPFLRQCRSVPCTPLYNLTTGNSVCDEQATTVDPTSVRGDKLITSTTAITQTTTLHPTLNCLLQALGLSPDLEGLVDNIIYPLQDGEYSQSFMANCTKATLISLSLVFEYYDQAFPLVEAIDNEFSAGTNDECPACSITKINIYLEKRATSAELGDTCKMFIEPQSELYTELPDGVNIDSTFLALAKFNLTSNTDDAQRAPDHCVQENQQTCVTNTLNPSDYQAVDEVDGHDRDIWVLHFNMTLHEGDYVLKTDGTVQVCSSLLLTPWPLRSIYEFAVISCTGLSVVALIVTFVIYLANSGLRDIPGKCLLSMIAALILGLLLSVLSEFFLFHHIACTTVAVVAHFAWLGAFGWLTLFASVIAIRIKDNKMSLFCKIFVVGWLMPAVAIGLCLWIHFCQCMNVDISYGRESQCWLQGSEALLFSMVVPIIILLLVSTVALICGVIRIRKVREYMTAYSEEITDSTVSDVLLYIMMCLLLIIPWTLAAAYLLLNIEILNDVYEIAYSLQGVFVCAALISTSKVRLLCKQKPTAAEDAPPGVTRQISKRVDAPDGASNRVWLKRNSTQGDGGDGQNTWL